MTMGVQLDTSEAPTLERRTLAIPRRSVSPGSGPAKRDLALDHEAASAATTKILLRGGEVARARAFASLATVMAGLGFVTHVLFGVLHVVDVRHPSVHALVSVTLGTYCGVCAIVWRRLATRGELSRLLASVLSLSAVTLGLSLQVLLGPFSPVIAIVILGISFFGLSEERGISMFVSLIASLVLFPHALLVALEVVPDVGVFAAPGAPQPARFAMVALSFCVCLFSARQARTTQRAYGVAIEQSAAAARAVQQRDAQLLEAHEKIERLRGRGVGHHTGATVGNWRLQDVIGRGAMGEVYEAVHVASSQRGAMKLLSHASAHDPALVQRFLREVNIASRLRGAHLVQVFEAGISSDGIPYIAMERLDGSDLGARLRQETTLDLTQTSALVRQVAQGLGVAHAAGVVHRDLKPANIFRAARDGKDTWTLLDFGIAAVNGTTNGTLTHGDIVGTPGYMSPEQALGNRGDARSDIFSLGAVAYRVLTGVAPFAGNVAVALHAVVYEGPPAPRSLTPELPSDVERVLALALAKDPGARFASVTAFAAAFDLAIQGKLDPETRGAADALVESGAWKQAERALSVPVGLGAGLRARPRAPPAAA